MLLKANAAILLNKICKTKQLTPKYINTNTIKTAWTRLCKFDIQRTVYRDIFIFLYIFIYSLQLCCHPVAVHIYTQTLHRTTQITTEQHK
jgi:hypothetical protein